MRSLPRTVALASLYHGEDPKRLSEALDSALSQSLKLPIALVVDGPLSVKLEEELSTYVDRIDFIFRLEKNSGLAVALQYALVNLAPHFDYLIRFDTDDVNLPTRFEVLMGAIVSEGYDLLGSSIEEFSEECPQVTLGIRVVPPKRSDILKRIHWRNPFNHPSVAYRIQSALRVGGYEEVPFFEDWYLWARMVKSGSKVGNLETPLVRFRGGDGALARRHGLAYANHEIFFYQKLFRVGLPRRWVIFLALPLRLLTRILHIRLFTHVYYYSRRFF